MDKNHNKAQNCSLDDAAVKVARIAVFAPLPQLFDYRVDRPDSTAVGSRVKISFGRSERFGLVVHLCSVTDYLELHDRVTDIAKLKPLQAVIDENAIMPDGLLELCRKTSAYYHYPLGEVFSAALPSKIRAGGSIDLPLVQAWHLTDQGKQLSSAELKRSPVQMALLESLIKLSNNHSTKEPRLLHSALTSAERGALLRLETKGIVERQQVIAKPEAEHAAIPVKLNPQQEEAVDVLSRQLAISDGNTSPRFTVSVLNGVTGSGKTEVYLALIQKKITAGEQTLLLVPEINLTPQLLDRVRSRLAARIVVLHSGLTDNERANAWVLAKAGLVDVVIGTRSAVFTPLLCPGLIVVDEEHDGSFKQQEGFRYSARDLAVMRGQIDGHPVLLGSATPALETIHNVAEGRYHEVRLDQRNGEALPPRMRLVDVLREGVREGFTPSAIGALDAHLQAGQQVLVFQNRRGYAPLMLCNACGWQADCQHCSAHLTLHRQKGKLTCHHCGFEQRTPSACPDCKSIDLGDVGQGTERLEAVLRERFPEYGLVRVDSDTTSSKSGLAKTREAVLSGEAKILVGTQLLAKGHHFPNVTLVLMVDVDGMLKSPDPRAAEQAAQMIVQVAGRAGRGQHPGEVLIQTRYVHHPLLIQLIRNGYQGFAETELALRKDSGMPPYHRMALLRSDALDKCLVREFLDEAKQLLPARFAKVVFAMGPATSIMERRAGRYRMQLILNAASRGALQQLLAEWLPQLRKLRSARRVRWSIDVDPIDFY